MLLSLKPRICTGWDQMVTMFHSIVIVAELLEDDFGGEGEEDSGGGRAHGRVGDAHPEDAHLRRRLPHDLQCPQSLLHRADALRIKNVNRKSALYLSLA